MLLDEWSRLKTLARRARRGAAPAAPARCPDADTRRRVILSATLATITCEVHGRQAAAGTLGAEAGAHERRGEWDAAARLRAEEAALRARLAVAEALHERLAADLAAIAGPPAPPAGPSSPPASPRPAPEPAARPWWSLRPADPPAR